MRASVGPGGAFAYALILVLLQNAQKLHLQLRRKVADLIEEERAVGGEFESSNAIADRAR